jgi:tRNA/rRNA methyltransferase
MNEMNKEDLLKQIRVVLCQTSHPGNIGSAARAMKTMGLSQLYLVNPRKFPHAEATSMASGATDVLEAARVCESLEQALQGCGLVFGMTARQRELSHPPQSPRRMAADVLAAVSLTPALSQGERGTRSRWSESHVNETVALVFGNETSGLSNDELIRCQRLVHIPANPEYSSLNLAAAVQLAAYELRVAALGDGEDMHQAPHPNPYRRIKPATHDEIEGFYGHLEQTLIAIGFLDPQQPRRLMSRLRRLFARAGLQQEEINILRGILKAVLKK